MDNRHGMIFVIGIGPGHVDEMTIHARTVLDACDTIVGYKMYVGLIASLVQEKEIITSGMTQEQERCCRAIEEAAAGKRVALISGGDSGIYGMSGLLLEIAGKDTRSKSIPIEIIPGVPAFVAAAAALGAPFMNDYAIISLSDLLTPWNKIEKRLAAAASGDFVTCIYNPKSRSRAWQIERAIEIFVQYRKTTTPCAIVKNVSRPEQQIIRALLGTMLDYPIDMSSIVIIGNSETFFQNEWLITPRGYAL